MTAPNVLRMTTPGSGGSWLSPYGTQQAPTAPAAAAPAASTPYNPYTVARPKPTTWQGSEVDSAQDLWNQQAPGVYGAESDALAAQGTATQGSQTALSRLGNFMAPNTNAGVSGRSFNAASADTAALENFDPSAAGTTYATGAEDQFNLNLQQQLGALQSKSAGTGRLQTGFYTADQGTVAEELGQNFNAQLAQAATTFSGQRLSALQGAATGQTNIAEDQAGNELTSSGQNLTARNDALTGALSEEQMARNTYQADANTAGAYTSATRDWASQDKTSQDQIDYNTALALYMQGKGGFPTGPGGPTLAAAPPSGYAGVQGTAGQPSWQALGQAKASASGLPFSWGG